MTMSRMRKAITEKTIATVCIVIGLVPIATELIKYFFLEPPRGHNINSLGGGFLSGLLFISLGIFAYYRASDGVIVDERNIKINSRAGTLSLYFSWLLLGMLAALASKDILHISFELIVWVVWIAMPCIFFVLLFIYRRKGEKV